MVHGWITEGLPGDISGMRATARAFIEKEALPLREADPRAAQPELLRKAAALGLTGPDVGEEHGGLGLTRVAGCHIVEELIREASFGVSMGVHTGIGMWPVQLFGTDAQRGEWLPRIVRAEALTAYALTEPEAGSNAMGVRLKVTRNGPDFVLNGQKLWISNAGFADLFTVFGRLPEGIVAFLVPRATPGVSVGAEEVKMGLHGSSTAAVFFEEVRVPEEHVLGEVGRGHKIAFGVLNLGRLKLAAGSVGMARQALQAAAAYAQERPQFASRIVEFPAIREKLARMAARLYAAESLTYAVAAELDAAEHAPGADRLKVIDGAALECSAAKVVASETCGQVVDDALQVFGGIGYSAHAPVERIARDCRVFRIFEGTSEVNALVVIERFIHRHGGVCDIKRHCARGPLEEQRRTFWEAFDDQLCLAMDLIGSKAFLGSVHVPKAQEEAWPLSQALLPLLALEAMAAREESPLRDAAMHWTMREALARMSVLMPRSPCGLPDRLLSQSVAAPPETQVLVEAALNC